MRIPELIATLMEGDGVITSINQCKFDDINEVDSTIELTLHKPLRQDHLWPVATREFSIDDFNCAHHVQIFSVQILDTTCEQLK